MKKILFLIIFISQLAEAQKYQPFDTAMFWRVKNFSVNLQTFSDCHYYLDYYIHGYILNNGRIWHKVYSSGRESDSPCGKTYILNKAEGLFYNDTINKRVYFIDSTKLLANYTPTSNDILFDFKKQVGSYMQSNYKVSRIDSTLFNNRYHKIFVCSIYETSIDTWQPAQAHYIEGVGSSQGVFNTFYNVFGAEAHKLVCFSIGANSRLIHYTNSGIQAYASGMTDTSNCEDLPTGIFSLEKNNSYTLSVFPNPASEFIYIQTDEILIAQSLKVVVSDLFGSEVKNLEIKQKSETVAISNLSPGTYLLKLYLKNKLTETKKIIVLR